MYVWLILNQLLQQGPFHLPSTQEGSVVTYSPNAHNQHERNCCIGHRGRLCPMPGYRPVRLSPRKSVIPTPHPNQCYGREISTGWCRRRHRFYSPCTHQYRCPQHRHTKVYWERQKQSKPHMTNVRSFCHTHTYHFI